jgi:hypothetical protein
MQRSYYANAERKEEKKEKRKKGVGLAYSGGISAKIVE